MQNHYELQNDSTFIAELQNCASALVEKIENDDFEEASEMIGNMIETRDNHLFSAIGQLTRGLHDAIVNFHVDADYDAQPIQVDGSDIHDATDRLNYVIDLTQKAADKTMDMVEECAPIAMDLGKEATNLQSDWSRLRRREMTKEEFSELYKRMDIFLGQMCSGTSLLNQNLQNIILEQGFQDLTGQVLKRVMELITDVETKLVELVRMASQVDQITGVVHATEEKKDKPNAHGPQINPEKKSDVVANQDDVDDLLSSLGF